MEHMECVERATNGDLKAFRELVGHFRRFVFGICLSVSHDPNEAEDLTQEVFLAVYRDLPNLRDREKFLPWLRKLTQNTCYVWLRKRGELMAPIEDGFEGESAAAEDGTHGVEVRQIALDTLARVSDKSREVLVLRYLAGCSEAEIASALDVPRTTVKSRLYEGRSQARKTLEPLVKELLQQETQSDAAVERIMARCGSPDCRCPETLTEGR